MRFLAWLALTIAIPGAWAVSIPWTVVDRAVIEERLRAVPQTNSAREQFLRETFEKVGCKGDQLTEQQLRHVRAPNLICKLPGTTDRVIVVGAHFDFVDRGSGAVDNWSGASLLPSLFQSLASSPRRHTFLLVSFTDEEKGLVGSKYFVQHLAKEELEKISGMVNMDSLGTTPTKVETYHADPRMLRALGAVAESAKLPLAIVNVHNVGLSDSDSFDQNKVPIIDLHSITQETLPILHSARDQLKAIDLGAYYDSYRLIAGYLAYLDITLDAAESPK